MKRILLTAVFGLALMTAGAQGKIVIDIGSQPNIEYALSNVKKMTFEDGMMKTRLKHESHTSKIRLADIRRIYIAYEDTGIGSGTGRPQIEVNYDGRSITIPDMEGPVKAYVYAVDGTIVSMVNNWNGQKYDVSRLPSGTYMLKAGKITVKFFK